MAAGAPDCGQRYCLYHPAAQRRPLGALVYVHPFAEELNKTRRMAALQSRALAGAGYAVLQVDLLGCGDSSGDFADASWSAWLDDVVRAAHWLQQRVAAPLWLWGLRVGCLLAAEAAPIVGARRLLLWQPVAAGRQALQQFLRLKLAGDLLGGAPKGSVEQVRGRLAAGEAVDVAGYALSPKLARGLEGATLSPPPDGGRLEWLEVSARPDGARSVHGAAAEARWRQAGWDTRSALVAGAAFWQSVETEEAPQLLASTLAAMARPGLPC